MVAVRERALSSINNALPGTTLQTRYKDALFTLKKVCSGRLIWTFTELGKLYFSTSKESLMDSILLPFHFTNYKIYLDLYKLLGILFILYSL